MPSSSKRSPLPWLLAAALLVVVVAAAGALILRSRAAAPNVSTDAGKHATLGAALQGQAAANLNGSLAASLSAQPKAENLSTGQCECVTYVVYRLFGQRLPLDPGTAENMATDTYWNQPGPDGKPFDGGRHRLTRDDNVLPGDVVIFAHDAIVYPWSNALHDWDRVFKTNPPTGGIGWGAGHVGIVERAEYWYDFGGWYIVMRNANWPDTWGNGYETESYENVTCANVQSSAVFIPSGAKVSFWRKN